jgi:hypothetical protein
MGEYLGRLYLQAKNRPLFVIAEILTGAEITSRRETQEPGFDPGR